VQHPDTLTSVYCLAHLLHAMKRYAEAARLYQRAYSGRVKQLSFQHTRTIACGKRLSAPQQEAKRAGLVDDRDLARRGKGAIINTAAAENAFVLVSEQQAERYKQRGLRISLLARMKESNGTAHYGMSNISLSMKSVGLAVRHGALQQVWHLNKLRNTRQVP